MVLYSKKRQNMALFFKIETLKSSWFGDFYASVAERADGSRWDSNLFHTAFSFLSPSKIWNWKSFFLSGSNALHAQHRQRCGFNQLPPSCWLLSIDWINHQPTPDSSQWTYAWRVHCRIQHRDQFQISTIDSLHSSSSNESSSDDYTSSNDSSSN